MKKIKLLIALIAASIGPVQDIWARIAPSFPTDQVKTLESGQNYYLYNPGSDRFIQRSNSNVIADPSSRARVTITNVEGDVYTLQFLSSGYWIYSSNNDMNASSNPTASYRKFRIDPVESGYSIQRDYNFNENYYVGNATGNSKVSSNFTSGNIVWQLYDADGAAAIIRYRAKKALYDALVSAEDYSLSFALEEYEALYANDAATNDELTTAANIVNNALFWKDKLEGEESEYPIYIQLTGSATWYYDKSNGKYTKTTIVNGEGGLKATVEVDEDATLIYDYHLASSWTDYSFNVYLDGSLYQQIKNYEGYDSNNSSTYYQRFFVELTAGKHIIEWKAESTNESTETEFYLKGIAAYKTPTITINVTQPGGLGTEILYNVDHVKDVRKLVVKGCNLNSEDWERIHMMTSLFDLDLSETAITSLPTINPSSFFHKLKLPNGLTTIQASALSGRPLDELTFPSTLTTIEEGALRYTRIKEVILPETVTNIGSYAFANNETLTKLYMPESVTSVGTYAFMGNRALQEVTWSPQAKTIPNYCFDGCYNISTFNIPEGITAIGTYAMRDNLSCKYQLPSTITSIGAFAFEDADQIETLTIPENTSIGAGAFQYCSKLKRVQIGNGATFGTTSSYYPYNSSTSSSLSTGFYTFRGCNALEEIELPTTFYTIPYGTMLSGCTALKKVTFKSPTLIDGDKYNTYFSGLGTDFDVYVPSYLVNAYKLDSYWYNYNIIGFSTADVTDWCINNTLTFGSQDRFEGTPNVNLQVYGMWTINGNVAQDINDFYTWYNSTDDNGGAMGSVSKLISNCDNVRINGKYQHGYYLYNHYRQSNGTGQLLSGRWHFICLPFDIKVSEISCSNNARFAIRYYDGANRAVNGTGGNWKDYDNDATIPAGTGFIIQASKACRAYFTALDNASKQNVVSNKIFTKALDANLSEQSSNKGWNLVGNPWLCYYNIHKLNFTGAITVYNGFKRTYTAYSIIDDDYAILPNEAFFVQCPDEVNEISFSVDGRQMTSVIESQNGVKEEFPQAPTRWLVDVELSDGEQSDKSRFVLNEKASMNYETCCDASKFIEAGTACPQIYTIENAELLAINERPMSDGIVALGITVAQSGTYTISTPRNDFLHIWLLDLETGKETDLCNGSYTFRAEAGTDETRFMLSLNENSIPTCIDVMKRNTFGTSHTVYTLDGRQTKTPTQKGIYIVDGKKVIK